MSVSMFILITPKLTASDISFAVEPDPPWNTRSKGRFLEYFFPTAF